MDYIATGLSLMDVLEYPDGTRTKPQMGGVPMYGFCGMRVWTDSILFSARVGEDFFDFYDPWFTTNHIASSGLTFVSQQTPHTVMIYTESENSVPGPFVTGNWDDADLWRPKPQDFDGKLNGVKGFYLTSGPPPEEIWDGLLTLRDQYHFKIMWEPNGSHIKAEDREAITSLCGNIEMASFSVPEGKCIFNTRDEEELIDILKQLGPELILLRAGSRGLYSIHNQKAWFIPTPPLGENVRVVDVTGCGNASTAGACYAWCEGNDPIMTGIMANISAYYNFRQKGPWPLFNDRTTLEARKFAKQLREDYHAAPI